MGSRIVRPDTTRLTISNGDWLLVKKRLNHGERQAAFARKYITEGTVARLDLRRMGMDQVLSYLLDWSLTDLEEKPLVIRGQPPDVVESLLNMIDDESFDEIALAITQHEEAMAKEREQEKKLQGGSSPVPSTSASPSTVDGPSIVSVS